MFCYFCLYCSNTPENIFYVLTYPRIYFWGIQFRQPVLLEFEVTDMDVRIRTSHYFFDMRRCAMRFSRSSGLIASIEVFVQSFTRVLDGWYSL